MTELFNNKSQTPLRRKLRNEMPKGENILWQKLRRNNLGVRFRRQFGIGKYIIDFYCPKLHLAIEVDGFTHDFKDQVDYDKKRQNFIEAKGITLLRFNSQEIFDDADGIASYIYLFCNNLLKNKI